MERNEVLEKLKELDKKVYRLYGDKQRISMVIVGGSAFLLGSYFLRSTLDIDLYGMPHISQSLLDEFDMNTNVNAYSMMEPYNYQDRLVKIDIDTKVIDYYRFSLEDLVVMKLASNRGRDVKDIIEPDVLSSINWELLEKIVYEECDNSFNDVAYKELIRKFEEYKKEYKK